MQVYSIKHLFASKRVTNNLMLQHTEEMLAAATTATAGHISKFKTNYINVTLEQHDNDAKVVEQLDLYFKSYNCAYLKGTLESAIIIPQYELKKFILSTTAIDFNEFCEWILEKISTFQLVDNYRCEVEKFYYIKNIINS